VADLYLTADKTTVEPNESVLFTVTFTSPYEVILLFVRLHFGDGTWQDWQVGEVVTYWSVMATKSYSSEGIYGAYAECEYADPVDLVSYIIASNVVYITVRAKVPEFPVTPPTPVTPTPVRPEEPPTVVEPWEPEEPPLRVVLPPPTEPPPIDWRPGPLPPDVVPPPRTRDTDIFTLRAFAAKWGDQITRYALNVPLDSGEIVDDLEEPYRTLWAKLTAHKADLVFERKGIIYVAEIKPRLSRGAIGEAITAHELFKRLHKPRQETRAAVICLTAHPILVQTAGWLGVLVFVVEQVDTGQPAGLYRPLGRERT
jgi:hypothetical protein